MPAEGSVISYLAKAKSWQRADYRLEHRESSDYGKCSIVAAIHSDDANAPDPGAGWSLLLRVDAHTNAVLREIASQ